MASILPLLGLGGVALLLVAGKSHAKGGGALPPAPNPKYDANLPAVLEATVDQELMNETNPDELERFAQSLDTQGFPIAAAALRKREAELRAPNPPPPPAINPVTPPAPKPIPSPSGGASGPGTFGTDATEWDPSWPWPDPDPKAASYSPGSAARVRAIQSALNLWAQQVALDPNMTSGVWPLTVDGDFGPLTAKLTAAFQEWINMTNASDYGAIGMTLGAPLVVDGEPGPLTVAWLNPWYAIP